MYVVISALPFVYNPHLRNGTLIIDIVSQHTQCKGSERITRHYFVKSSHSHNYTCFALGQSWPVGKEGHLVDISPSSLLLQVSITSTSTSYLPPIESKSLQKGLFENLKQAPVWLIHSRWLPDPNPLQGKAGTRCCLIHSFRAPCPVHTPDRLSTQGVTLFSNLRTFLLCCSGLTYPSMILNCRRPHRARSFIISLSGVPQEVSIATCMKRILWVGCHGGLVCPLCGYFVSSSQP